LLRLPGRGGASVGLAALAPAPGAGDRASLAGRDPSLAGRDPSLAGRGAALARRRSTLAGRRSTLAGRDTARTGSARRRCLSAVAAPGRAPWTVALSLAIAAALRRLGPPGTAIRGRAFVLATA